jgi:hypothetical protein
MSANANRSTDHTRYLFISIQFNLTDFVFSLLAGSISVPGWQSVHLLQNTISAQRCLPNFGPEHAACVPSLEMLVPPGEALVHEANIRVCSHKKVLSRPTGAEQRGQCFWFSVVFTPSSPNHQGSVWVLPVVSLLLIKVKAWAY